jgi:hypothetical protein
MLIEFFISYNNIYFKKIKILIHFVLSFMWNCIRKAKLFGQIFITSDISKKCKFGKNIEIWFRL